MLFEIFASAAAFHVVPNVIMKAVKKSHAGRQVLAASFSVGVEHGRKSLTLSVTAKDIMTYGFGPETMAEYELGVMLGKKIAEAPEAFQEGMLESFKQETLSKLEGLNEEEVAEVEATPFMGSLVEFARGERNMTAEALLNKLSKSVECKRTWKHYVAYAGILTSLAFAAPHALVQPLICAGRKAVATSKYGKEFFKKSFEQGKSGNIHHKAVRAAIDLLVSPAALDMMRAGNMVNKLENRDEKAA